MSCSANMISTENKEVKNFHTHGNRHKPKSFPTSYKLRLKTGLKSTILLCYDDIERYRARAPESEGNTGWPRRKPIQAMFRGRVVGERL